jgi:restriction system protein
MLPVLKEPGPAGAESGRIDVDLLLKYPAFQEFHRGESPARGETVSPDAGVSPSRAASTTPEEQIEAAHLALQSALGSELLQLVLQNSPCFLSQLSSTFLSLWAMAGPTEALRRSLGVPVTAVLMVLSMKIDSGSIIYIQVKRYAEGHVVGRPDAQGFVGSLVGLGVTEGVFSGQAIEFARHLTQRTILIDGKRLADLMIEHALVLPPNLNVSTRIFSRKTNRFRRQPTHSRPVLQQTQDAGFPLSGNQAGSS